MPPSDHGPDHNLTGTWHGLYTYPDHGLSVAFLATLTDTDHWLTGTTEETGTVGDEAGRTLIANLQGRRTGRVVTMLKIYQGPSDAYDSVHYEGSVNEDGTEIAGRWIVSNTWSGTFLMIRPKPVAADASVETAVRL